MSKSLLYRKSQQTRLQPPKTFTSPRLTLRLPSLKDAQSIFETYAQDPEVTKYLLWKPHRSIRETKDFLRYTKESWSKGTEYTWSIVLKETLDLIGMIALRITLPRADFGYVIAKPYWNKGYTTEAARLIVNWAISQNQIYRVWSLVDVDNTASARVLEKAGLEREGILRRWMYHSASGEPRDCICYAKVK